MHELRIAPAFPVFCPFYTDSLLIAAVIALEAVDGCLRELDSVCRISKRRYLFDRRHTCMQRLPGKHCVLGQRRRGAGHARPHLSEKQNLKVPRPVDVAL